MKTYKEKLKDPRWIERREAFKLAYTTSPLLPIDRCALSCIGCGGLDSIDIHHVKYIAGLEPWDYKDEHLAPLCRSCHELFHKNKKLFSDILSNSRMFYSYEMSCIIKVAELLCRLESHDIKNVVIFTNSLVAKQIDF